MKKLGLLCLILSGLYSSMSEARVCFLADPRCGSGYDEFSFSCKDSLRPEWIHEKDLLPSKSYDEICRDDTDVYYIDAGCDTEEGWVDINNIGNKYVCASEVIDGCCNEKKCSSKYTTCSSPTIGGGDKCTETNTKYYVNGSPYKYSKCVCDENKYPYSSANCNRSTHNLTGEKCEGDNGTFWTMCKKKCDFSSEKSCTNSVSNSKCEKNNSDGCWYISGCIDGYKLQNGVCVSTCTHTTQESCQKQYTHSECKADDKGCFVPYTCKSSYVNSCGDKYDLTNTDGNNCGVCTTKDCSKYIDCSKFEDLVGKGKSCTNAQGTFWEKCEVPEKCYVVNTSDPAYTANGGNCEIVTTEASAKTYLNNGYYAVETCQPVDTSAKPLVRLHKCESSTLDCLGNYPNVYNATTGGCLNSNDGKAKTCGGKTYATECKCNNNNDETLCRVFEITDSIKQEYKTNSYASTKYLGNTYIYQGDIKEGCENFDKKYGYFATCSSNGTNYCDKNRGPLFPDYPYACSTSEVCDGKSIECGDYTYCSQKCTDISEKDPCEKYNTYSHTGSVSCKVAKAGSSISFYREVGIVPETKNSSVQCAYFTSCTTSANCSKIGITESGIPAGYQSCYNVPDNANTLTCGGYSYASSCCEFLSNCQVTTDKSRLEKNLTKGYYQVNVSGVDSGCYYYASCTADTKDCAGNYAPARGAVAKSNCSTYAPEDYFTCGGKEYVRDCLAECAYDKTEEECSAIGKKFNLKCYKKGEKGKNDLKLGECV